MIVSGQFVVVRYNFHIESQISDLIEFYQTNTLLRLSFLFVKSNSNLFILRVFQQKSKMAEYFD